MTTNVLGKCDVLGEAMQPFVHHRHDGVVKIKYREELRSRYAKLVYCNHNRVVRECHVSRCRDREPSRIPVKKLKRLSQKSRKLRVFVWKKILKITPLSSKLHVNISCRLGSFEKVRKKPSSVRRKFRQTVRLTCFGKYIGTRKRVNLKKYQVLYTCCGPMSLYKNGDHR